MSKRDLEELVKELRVDADICRTEGLSWVPKHIEAAADMLELIAGIDTFVEYLAVLYARDNIVTVELLCKALTDKMDDMAAAATGGTDAK